MIMPRIDRGEDGMRFVILADDGGGKRGQRRHADDRLAGGERDAARGGKADAQSGKAAGTGRRGDAVERGKGNAGRLHHARDQRHQGFGMAALHRQQFLRDHVACAGVEHGRGAGIKRGIDGEDEHDASVEVFQLRLNALPRYFRVYIHREAAATPLYLRSALPVEIAGKRLAPHFRCMCIIMQLHDAKLLKLREIRFFFTNR